jgi:hypothetical protein
MSARAGNSLKKIALLMAAAALAACQMTGDNYDRPALLVGMDDADRASLRSTVNDAVGGDVTLSDSALTDSSVLTIETMPPRSIDNPSPHGRVLEAPIQFRLVRNGEDCVLIDQRDRSRHVIPGVECVAD